MSGQEREESSVAAVVVVDDILGDRSGFARTDVAPAPANHVAQEEDSLPSLFYWNRDLSRESATGAAAIAALKHNESASVVLGRIDNLKGNSRNDLPPCSQSSEYQFSGRGTANGAVNGSVLAIGFRSKSVQSFA